MKAGMEYLAASLFLLLRLLTLVSALARNLDPPRYDTAYACEGKVLKIECREGELIQLIRANYGRFSITICNDHGNTEWSVNCMSPKSFRVLHSKCTQQQNCSIPANTSLFGDPCAGTLKYLEAHYRCIPAAATTTTTRPSPPWLMASQPNVWSTAKLPTLRPPSHPPYGRATVAPPPADPAPEKVTQVPPPSVPKVAVARESSSTRSPGPNLERSEVTPTTASPGPSSSSSSSAPSPVSSSAVASSSSSSSSSSVASTSSASSSSPQPPPPLSSPWHPPSASSSHSPPSSSSTWKTTGKPERVPSGGSFPDYSEYNPLPTASWVPEGETSQFCAPTTSRNLDWNWTHVGEVNVQPCPGGAAGLARWRCIHSAEANSAKWSPPGSPDLSQCRSVWLTSLDSRIEENDSVVNVANDLSQVTSSKTLYGGDMMTTTSIVKKMTERISKSIQTFPDSQQREAIVAELLQSVVKTTSNLLDSSQDPSWRDLSHREQMRVATSLLVGLEENAFLLADTVIREKTVVQAVKNILLSVRVVDVSNVQETERFPDAESLRQRPNYTDWLEVPRTAMLDNSEGGFVRLIFVAFERLDDLLRPRPEEELPTSEDDDDAAAAAAAAAAVGDDRRNATRIVNTKVISASLGKGRHIQFTDFVRLGMKHLRTENVSNPTCVFWDYTLSAWSEEGCEIEFTNKTHTVCRCNHLTNFAVLMDVDGGHGAPTHRMTLQIITYVGCIVSIVCLLLAVITFQLFRSLRSDRNTIHKNLCTCLLLAEILFLLGISQTDKPILCGVVAGLLHFVFLCAFAWMFLEGFQLYIMLIEVFEVEKSRIRWYYMFAYGAPLIIVSISCVVDPLSYGTERYCWLRADNFFIFSFVGPVIAVILANLVFLSMAIYMMCRHSSASVSLKSKEHSRLASARTWLRGAIVLVFLLGLTWTFGLLYLNEESAVMAYVFSVLNSLQGLFIFLFHCLHNEKVRKEYRKWNSWLPKCVKCKKYQGSSGGIGKERRSSVYGTSHGPGSGTNSHTHPSTMVGDPMMSLPNGNSSKIYFKSHNNDLGHGQCGDDLRSGYGHHGGHHPQGGGMTLASLPASSFNIHGHDTGYADRVSTLRSLHGDADSIRRQQYRHGSDRVLVCELERHPHGSRAATLQLPRRRRDHYGDDIPGRKGDVDDPVYEEIRQAASDASDEELRRCVASRQSLRSCGDHSPLIPSPHGSGDPGRGHHHHHHGHHHHHHGHHGSHAHVVPDPHAFLYSPRSHGLSIDR